LGTIAWGGKRSVNASKSVVLRVRDRWWRFGLSRVPAKVVLNAFTTRAPDAFAAISATAEPASTVSGVNEGKSTGLVMSTTTLPDSWSL